MGRAGIESFNVVGRIFNSEVLAGRDKMTVMHTAKLRRVSARFSFTLGVVGMIVGAVDPLEGSVVIVAGSGLVTLGSWLGRQPRGLCLYRTWLFGLMAFGVITMFIMSAFGGLGGRTGHSMWWALLLLPYPLGWILAMANLVSRLIDRLRHHHAG